MTQKQLEAKIKENKKVIKELYAENVRLAESVNMFQNLTIKLADSLKLDWKKLNPVDIFIEAEKRINEN